MPYTVYRRILADCYHERTGVKSIKSKLFKNLVKIGVLDHPHLVLFVCLLVLTFNSVTFRVSSMTVNFISN